MRTLRHDRQTTDKILKYCAVGIQAPREHETVGAEIENATPG